MTTYAYDPSTTQLLATWPTGDGSTATTVARLHARTPEPLGRALARGLTQLSSTAWLSYSDSDLTGPLPGAAAVRAIEHPNLPRAGRQAGRRAVDPSWLVEYGHDIGRTLVEIGSAGVRRAVVVDVRIESDGSSGRCSATSTGRCARPSNSPASTRHRCRSRRPTGCCTRCRWVGKGCSPTSSRPPRAGRRRTGCAPRST